MHIILDKIQYVVLFYCCIFTNTFNVFEIPCCIEGANGKVCKFYIPVSKTLSETSDLYYKHAMIVKYAFRIINKFGASLTDDTGVVIYDRHVFIVQATAPKLIFNIVLYMPLQFYNNIRLDKIAISLKNFLQKFYSDFLFRASLCKAFIKSNPSMLYH
jgi:hypothetical protein